MLEQLRRQSAAIDPENGPNGAGKGQTPPMEPNGHTRMKARPTIELSGMGPNMLLAFESWRLSPRTNTLPAGTLMHCDVNLNDGVLSVTPFVLWT
jgi:hypothetical protein